jgi:hypothetical protein
MPTAPDVSHGSQSTMLPTVNNAFSTNSQNNAMPTYTEGSNGSQSAMMPKANNSSSMSSQSDASPTVTEASNDSESDTMATATDALDNIHEAPHEDGITEANSAFADRDSEGCDLFSPVTVSDEPLCPGDVIFYWHDLYVCMWQPMGKEML